MGDPGRMDFTDERLPTLHIGHPVFMNYRGEEVPLPDGLIERLVGELETLERESVAAVPSREAGLAFLQGIYRVVDRLGETIGPGMACSTGCSACCRVMVATTRVEADNLEERVRSAPLEQRKAWEDKVSDRNTLLRSLASRCSPEADLTSFEGLLATCEDYERANTPCPFLGEDNLCQVYESRPLLCRVCWVLTDPRDCDPGEGPPVKFRTAVFQKAHELVAKVSLRHFGDGRVSPIPYWFRDASRERR